MKGRYLFLFLSALVLLVLCSDQVQGASCESCHSSRNPSAGWVFHPPVISLVHDPFQIPGSDFTVKLIVTGASDYSIRSLGGSVASIYGTIEMTGAEEGSYGVDDQGNGYVEWEFNAGEAGESVVVVDVDYEVYYKHDVPGQDDRASYFETIETDILVADLDLTISPGSLIFQEKGESQSVLVTAREDVTDIQVVISTELIGSIEVFQSTTSLLASEDMTIDVKVLNLTDIISHMTIKWKENGVQREIDIEIVITYPGGGSGGRDILWETGKYTGIAAYSLVIIGYFTGGFSPFKKTANKVFKTAKRRVDFHCALSYTTLILVATHLVTLIYGPFTDMILFWEVILGWMALITMLIISLNGIFQKKFVKLMGYQNWRRVHAWGSYVITALVAVHMLLYGSHFSWFRESIGYG